MATDEGASAAISALDGKFLALREGGGNGGGGEEEEEEKEEKKNQGLFSSSLAVSPSLVLLVSDEPFGSPSSAERKGATGIRVEHALSREARQHGGAAGFLLLRGRDGEERNEEAVAAAAAAAASTAAAAEEEEEARQGRARASLREHTSPRPSLCPPPSPRAGANEERW